MKHGKKLKLWQKKFLKSQGMDPGKYLFCKRDADSLIFISRETGKPIPPIRR